jgi:hypothetical protein
MSLKSEASRVLDALALTFAMFWIGFYARRVADRLGLLGMSVDAPPQKT